MKSVVIFSKNHIFCLVECLESPTKQGWFSKQTWKNDQLEER